MQATYPAIDWTNQLRNGESRVFLINSILQTEKLKIQIVNNNGWISFKNPRIIFWYQR